MKYASILFLASTLLALGASAASAHPGDRPDRDDDDSSWSGRGDRGDRGDRDDDSSWRDGWDDRSDGHNLDQRWDDFNDGARYTPDQRLRTFARQGYNVRQIRRMMVARTYQRIDARSRIIHGRFGYGWQARNKVARMRARELTRLENRMRWVSSRYVAYVRPAAPHRRAWR